MGREKTGRMVKEKGHKVPQTEGQESRAGTKIQSQGRTTGQQPKIKGKMLNS